MAVYCFVIKFKNLVKVANILQSLKHIEKECNNTLSLTTTLCKFEFPINCFGSHCLEHREATEWPDSIN